MVFYIFFVGVGWGRDVNVHSHGQTKDCLRGWGGVGMLTLTHTGKPTMAHGGGVGLGWGGVVMLTFVHTGKPRMAYGVGVGLGC